MHIPSNTERPGAFKSVECAGRCPSFITLVVAIKTGSFVSGFFLLVAFSLGAGGAASSCSDLVVC